MKKGSYTIEAAIFVPILLFMFVAAMNTAIHLYQEIRDGQPEYYSETLWVVDTFYHWEMAGGLLDGEN
jgi:hypothetical protein